MLRSKINSVTPIPEQHLKREFVVVEEKVEQVSLYDKNGKVVSEQIVRVPIRVPIPKETWEHKGESCDLYTIENQLNANVDLREFHGDFLTPSLAESSYLGEVAIQQINARLEQEKQNVESQNNE